MKVKVSGVWKDPYVYTRVGGIWKAPNYGYVRVAGAWRRFYRRDDLYYRATITMGSWVNDQSETVYDASYDLFGAHVRGGTLSNLALTNYDGKMGGITHKNVAENGYPAYRSLAIIGFVDLTGMVIPRIKFNGVWSVEVTQPMTYFQPYAASSMIFGFASNLPTTGTYEVMF